eukprot:gene6195-6910_t
MALKLMLIVLLGLTAVYAVPAPEYDDEDDADLEDLANSVEDEPSEDEEDEVMEDESEDEEDPKKKVSKKKKYHAIWNKKAFCVCKIAAKKGDEPMTQDELEEGLAENDPKMTKAAIKAAIKKAIKKLVSPYFKAVNLNCHCTKEKRVLRLFYYLHMLKNSKAAKTMRGYLRKVVLLSKSLKKTVGGSFQNLTPQGGSIAEPVFSSWNFLTHCSQAQYILSKS